MTGPRPPGRFPPEALVADLRLALARAPHRTPEERFEAWAWRAMLDQEGPTLLTRHAAPAHVTASALVLSADGAATCLILHHRIRMWVQPGGHLEPEDGSLAAAAERETLEETGLTGLVSADPVVLSRHRAPCRPGEVDWHLDVQHLLLAERTPPRTSDESVEVAWWPLDRLPEPLAPGVADALGLALRRLID